VERKSSKNKKPTYEDRFKERSDEINKLGLNELKEYRERLIVWLGEVDKNLKDPIVKSNDKKRKYFIGLRKFVVIPLLNYSKERMKMINRVVYNGVTKDFAKRFVTVAADVLAMQDFQKIYGLTMTDNEKDSQTIDDIKKFIEECESKLDK